MKKCITWVMILLILATLTGCENGGSDVPKLKEPVSGRFDEAEVQIDKICDISVYNGEIRPYVEEIHFLIDGYLDQIKVSLGEYVQKGEVLATLEQDQILNQVKTLEEEIDDIVKSGEFSDRQANADIAIAKEELLILQESGAGAQSCQLKEIEIQKLELRLKQTKELRELEMQEKQRLLRSLKEQMGKNQITASLSGRVVYINQVKQGASVKGYTPMICIADESRWSLLSDYISESSITEAERVYAKVGDQEYEITYVPYENSTYAKIMSFNMYETTEFSFQSSAEEVESGHFATIMIQNVYKENVLTIPINALFQDGEGQYVYKIEENNRVRCNVTVGIVSDTKAEIVAGLQKGDVVYVKQ